MVDDVTGEKEGKQRLRSDQVQVLAKLLAYTLNKEHERGGSKASYFEQSLGYTKENAIDLARQLVFNEDEAEPTAANVFGQKYVQIIAVTSADGAKQRRILTSWIKRYDETEHKVNLVTAFRYRKNV